MSDVAGNAPSGAKKAPQAGDVSGAVVPESDGVKLTRQDRRLLSSLPDNELNSRIVGAGAEYHALEKRGLCRWRGQVFGGNAYSITEAGLLALRSTAPPQESTAPASSPVPEVTGA